MVYSKNAEAGFDALQKYAVDLTALAEEGKIDPVIGRDNEVRQTLTRTCLTDVITPPFRFEELSEFSAAEPRTTLSC